MRILGISAFYHDSAAALLVDGRIKSAAQEERFTRRKHDPRFPERAIEFCLSKNGLKISDLDAVVYYEKPFVKFDRLIETYLAFAPRGFPSFVKSMPVWIGEKLFQKKVLLEKLNAIGEFDSSKILFSEHHISHAASAFYPSPFEEAAVLTLDGVGEWATATCGLGRGSELSLMQEIRFPHSLGLLYSAFTYFCGFKVNSGEYKLMGLAPYGVPKYSQKILDHLIDLKDDGSFRLNLEYFDYAIGTKMTGERFQKLFGVPQRTSEGLLVQDHMDLAASIQAVTEEVMLRLARTLRKSSKNLTLAGGVALNCVANGKILREGIFENIWIQPASGDAGGALGAALAAHHLHFKKERHQSRSLDQMHGSYLGSEYAPAEIESRLRKLGGVFETCRSDTELIGKVASSLKDGAAVGWFQGAMEFGPRALGNRSIIADARSPEMQKNLNLKVKFRESFRPFAPSVLRAKVRDWFEMDVDSPYMLLVAPVHESRKRKMTEAEEKLFGIEKLNIPRSDIPAVTHVDYSARVQTVHQETNPKYYALLEEFEKLTGCPVLVNTSFNVRGEPIVESPEDAFRCFMGTNLDLLVVGPCILKKSAQDPKLAQDYKDKFELD